MLLAPENAQEPGHHFVFKAGSSSSTCDSGQGDDDPQTCKRVISNRRSAQRSRVRKVQQMSELEVNVETLGNELRQLIPQLEELRARYSELKARNQDLKARMSSQPNSSSPHTPSSMNNFRPKHLNMRPVASSVQKEDLTYPHDSLAHPNDLSHPPTSSLYPMRREASAPAYQQTYWPTSVPMMYPYTLMQPPRRMYPVNKARLHPQQAQDMMHACSMPAYMQHAAAQCHTAPRGNPTVGYNEAFANDILDIRQDLFKEVSPDHLMTSHSSLAAPGGSGRGAGAESGQDNSHSFGMMRAIKPEPREQQYEMHMSANTHFFDEGLADAFDPAWFCQS